MTKLTTHVLDVYSGKPGAGVKVELYYLKNNERERKNSTILNQDGRTDKPLLEGSNFLNGKYELVFFVGDHFKNNALIFWGEQDRATSLESGKKITHLIKNSKFYSYNGDHYFFMKYANEITTKINDGIL